MKIKKTSLVAFALMLLPILTLISWNASSLSFLYYYDELMGVVAIIYLTSLFISKKLSRIDNLMYVILLVITVVGIVSNIISGVTGNLFAIIVDVLFLWKPIACYLLMKNYANKDNRRNDIIMCLQNFAKITIIVIFASMVFGSVVDIGVFKDGDFYFFWHNAYQTLWALACALLILAAGNISKKKFIIYFILSVLPILFTQASLSLCWLLIVCVFLIVFKETTKLKYRYLALLGILLIAVCFADISAYLLNVSSPRMLLILGGITVASRYFPLGSGFATYGSDMASRFYSKLYEEFGFDDIYGMGKTGALYLNDNFFAGILGQFGYFGCIIYFVLIVCILKNTNTLVVNKRERVLSIATVLVIFASMMISASVKSNMGVFVMLVLGVLAAHPVEDKIEDKNAKIRI